MQIYLNGDWLSAEQAGAMRVMDAGLQHGVGLFETMAGVRGRVFRLEAHLARLDASARALGFSRGLDLDALGEAVTATVQRFGQAPVRVRLTVTAGDVSLLRGGAAGEQAPRMTQLIVAEPATQYDPAYFEQGATVVIAGPLANPFDPMAGHKTLNYWGRLRTLRQAASAGAGEAIWLSVTNHLASGAVSNLLLVKDGKVLTPIARGEEQRGAIPSPVLPGVTRAAVLEVASTLGIESTRKMLTVDDLLEADEVMLTNSGWQVLPVSRVEKKAIGDGAAGPITRQIRETLLGLIASETGASVGVPT